MQTSRRLAAIMFTDIEGYTKLMQQSEAKAVLVRNRHREVFEPTTNQYNGQIVNYYGDGTLSIFDSAVSAVQCACALQQQFRQNPVIPVRIGIHIGDILITEDDIIGDGVNLASRIESLAVAGSVLISDKVAEEIKNHEDLPVANLGSFHFKNDRDPRQVFAVIAPGLVVPKGKELKGKTEESRKKFNIRNIIGAILIAFLLIAVGRWISTFSKPIDRLALLPFTNLMQDSSNKHIVDGVHEALISKLLQTGVYIKPKTSMRQYRNTEKSVRQIAQELDVDALMEGTVSRSGNSIDIELRLIDASTENYIWRETFKTDLSSALSLYNEMTLAIAGQIQLALSPVIEARLSKTQLLDPEAYELYLQGRHHSNKGSDQDILKAIEYYKQSLAIDPNFGPTYTGLVESYLLQGFSTLSPIEAFAKFRIYAQKAIDLDEALEQDHHLLAMIKLYSDWDWAGAVVELKKAIIQDPSSSSSYDTYCQLLWAMGKLDESVVAGEKAVELDSLAHFANCDLIWAYFYAGLENKAKNQLQKTNDLFGSDCPYHYGVNIRLKIEEIENNEESYKDILAELNKRGVAKENDHSSIHFLLGYTYAFIGQIEQARNIIDQLKERARHEFVDPCYISGIHIALGDKDEAFRFLEQAYGQRSFLLLFTIKADPMFDPLRGDPRFNNLLERMGLTEMAD